MRPIVNVNLGGIQFIFNDNAYRLMSEYLQSLSDAFRAQNLDPIELLADIEGRCAEILSEEHDHATYIVTEKDIAMLIDRLGRPEEILDEQIIETPDFVKTRVNKTSNTPSYTPEPTMPVRKRLYRIGQGAELGGVCGGLAAYFGLDPTYVRLATVALAFLSCSTVAVIYIILWIVIPQAKTPWQEMELRGESPTLNNIGRSVKKIFGQTEASNSEKDFPYENLTRPSNKQQTDSFINRFFSVLFKIMLGCAGVVSLLIVVGLLSISIFGIIYGVARMVQFLPLPSYYFVKLGLILCGTIIAGLPLVLLSRTIMRILFPGTFRRSISQPWRLCMAIIWVIAVFICARMAYIVQYFKDTNLFFID